MKEIDHFMYAGRDLDTLSADFQRLSGIAPEAGGSHPTLGTRNSLAGTDSAIYLELIAPDPALDATGDLRAAFENLTRHQLYRVILRCDQADFPALAQAYEAEGIAAPVHDLQRRTPDGDTLRWKLMIPEPNPLGLFAPYFIDWLDTPHPSGRLADHGCTVIGSEAGHPDYARVQRLWQRLGVPIPLRAADHPYLRVLLQTPQGEIALTSAG